MTTSSGSRPELGIFGAGSAMSRLVEQLTSPTSAAKAFSTNLVKVDPFASFRILAEEHMRIVPPMAIFNTQVRDLLASRGAAAAAMRRAAAPGVDVSSALAEVFASGTFAEWRATLTGSPEEQVTQVVALVDRPEIQRAASERSLPSLPNVDLIGALCAVAVLLMAAATAIYVAEHQRAAALEALAGTFALLVVALKHQQRADDA